jgi:hypothetical protein
VKIAALLHTELLKDFSKPFRVELPSTAQFCRALLGAGQSLLAGVSGANVLWPAVMMSFSYDPDNLERDVRWFQVVAGPTDFDEASYVDDPMFLDSMWEQRPPPQGPSPVLLYEVRLGQAPK